MQIKPLCDSPDLGAACGFARTQYLGLAAGARPSQHLRVYKDLVCRFLLGDYTYQDVVEILPAFRLQQDILFVKNQWDVSTTPGGYPFYGPNSAPDHTFEIALNGTATIAVLGGPSMLPVVLTSSNPAVCSVTAVATTYAEVAALATVTLDPPYDSAATCVAALFTLTINAFGRASLHMTQDGNSRYAPVALFGGNFTFRAPPVPGLHVGEGQAMGFACSWYRGAKTPVSRVIGAIGAPSSVVRQVRRYQASSAGIAQPSSRLARGRLSVSTSAVGSPQSKTALGRAFQGGVGARGMAQSVTQSVVTVKPTALAIAYSITYESCHNLATGEGWSTYLQLHAVAARGGTLTYVITSMDVNCTAAISPPDTSGVATVRPNGIAWYGTTWFEFKVIETKDGVSVASDPAPITVGIAAPIPMSVSVSAGQMIWSGGTGPFKFNLRGNYTNIGLSTSGPGIINLVRRADGITRYALSTGSGYCTTDGYISLTDGINRICSASLAAAGVPLCSASTKKWQWVLKWTSPAGDIRNWVYWNSYMTMNVSCQDVSPVNMPQIAVTSTSGNWQIVGNYMLSSHVTSYYAPYTLSILGPGDGFPSGLIPADETFFLCNLAYSWAYYWWFCAYKIYAWEYV